MVALVSFFMSDVLVYTTSHIVDHGIGESADASQVRATAMHMQSMAGSARLMGSISGLMGYVVLGFALAREIPARGVQNTRLRCRHWCRHFLSWCSFDRAVPRGHRYLDADFCCLVDALPGLVDRHRDRHLSGTLWPPKRRNTEH